MPSAESTDAPDRPQELDLHLKSEVEFLTTLLTLDQEVMHGYSPQDLLDWFLYAKRSFRSQAPASGDYFGWGLRILDELGKLIFGLTAVTARISREKGSAWLLLRPQEGRLLSHYLKERDQSYESEGLFRLAAPEYEVSCRALRDKMEKVKAELRNADERDKRADYRRRYPEEYECRDAFRKIKLVATFGWTDGEAVPRIVLVLDRNRERDLERIKFARFFLHGVALFALTKNPGQPLSTPMYTVLRMPGDGWRTHPDGGIQDPGYVPFEEDFVKQGYSQTPEPNSTSVRLAGALAAAFFEGDFRTCHELKDNPEQVGTMGKFDLIFMCKEEDGWFWAFSKDQLNHLRNQERWKGEEDLEQALMNFRFRTAGIINHLERTDSLAEEVKNFKNEQLICLDVGYKLETCSVPVIEAFQKLELIFPGVENSSYCYFRISFPDADRAKKANEKPGLPAGSLVAVFRLSPDVWRDGYKRLKRLAAILRLVERWRAQTASLSTVQLAIAEIEKPLREQNARAAIMARNLSHNVGSHALANPRLHTAIGLEGLENYFPLEPCNDSTDVPSLASFSKYWDVAEDALPTPAPEPVAAPVATLPGRRKPTQLLSDARTRLTTFHQYTQTRLDFIARTLNAQVERPEPLFFINDVLNGFFRQTVLLDTLLADRGFPLIKGMGIDAIRQRQISFHVTIQIRNERHGYVFCLKDSSVENDGDREGGGVETFEADPRQTTLQQQKGGVWTTINRETPPHGVEDVLVGIPGGMIGCHALYSFLENIMRNAAKYGQHCERSDRGLEIHLRLRDATICHSEKPQDFFLLEIWENLSDDSAEGNPTSAAEILDFASASKIREYLGKDIIDKEGQMDNEGQGIQEMKIAANFLSGGARLRGDAERVPRHNECKEPDCPYCRFMDKVRAKNADGAKIPLIAMPQPLRCYVTDRKIERPSAKTSPDQGGGAQASIVYQLFVPKAQLVGIVDVDKPDDDPHPNKDSHAIVYHRRLLTLARRGAAFGVILDRDLGDKDAGNIHDRLESVRRFQHALPFRLIVLAASEERLEKWKQHGRVRRMLNGYQLDKDHRGDALAAGYDHEHDLPARRLHFIADKALHEALSAGGPRKESMPNINFLGAKGWQGVTLKLYHLWMQAFKGQPTDGAWKIVIGFERHPGQVASRWREQLEQFDYAPGTTLEKRGESSDLASAQYKVEIHLFENDSREGGPVIASQETATSKGVAKISDQTLNALKNEPGRDAYLVFDNHGKVFPLLSAATLPESSAFYQSFSGSKQVSLAQSLESPPFDAFSFGFFIYSLLEACLLRVAVLDERVAEAAMQGREFTNMTAIQRMRVFPLLSVRAASARADADWLTLLIRETVQRDLQSDQEYVRQEGLKIGNREVGLAWIYRGETYTLGKPPLAGVKGENYLRDALDAVIIHEGVVDVHWNKNWNKNSNVEQKLGRFAPRVIRTSGRGTQTRHLSGCLPFMEFSELSETTYRSTNKPMLGKAVCAVTGPPPDSSK